MNRFAALFEEDQSEDGSGDEESGTLIVVPPPPPPPPPPPAPSPPPHRPSSSERPSVLPPTHDYCLNTRRRGSTERDPIHDLISGVCRSRAPYTATDIDTTITRHIYMKHRAPPRKQTLTANPTDLTNPYYVAMVRCGWTPYDANSRFAKTIDWNDCITSDRMGPGWTFDRTHRTRTVLDRDVAARDGVGRRWRKGTVVYVGGMSTRDTWDDDYHVYADVVVVAPDQEQVEVFGYPEDVLRELADHCATLVAGNRVWITGTRWNNLTGRRSLVAVLDLETMEITRKETTGEDPGWLSGHSVTRVDEDSIEVLNIRTDYDRRRPFHLWTLHTVNLGKWTLFLDSLTWMRNTDENAIPSKTPPDEASARGLVHILDYW
ncbi:hypothetical protein HKX48_008820 [Thoreauomyces humboldtii]|nr:hypothetical protein HKX48_008820 [Thoreauomyces humboldtii]